MYHYSSFNMLKSSTFDSIRWNLNKASLSLSFLIPKSYFCPPPTRRKPKYPKF